LGNGKTTFLRSRERATSGVTSGRARCRGIYVDEDVVVDGNLITSRWPMDLPAFLQEVMRTLRERGKPTRDVRRASNSSAGAFRPSRAATRFRPDTHRDPGIVV